MFFREVLICWTSEPRTSIEQCLEMEVAVFPACHAFGSRCHIAELNSLSSHPTSAIELESNQPYSICAPCLYSGTRDVRFLVALGYLTKNYSTGAVSTGPRINEYPPSGVCLQYTTSTSVSDPR